MSNIKSKTPAEERVKVTIQAPEWNDKQSKNWFKFKKWIESVGGQWDAGMKMHIISFTPVQDKKEIDSTV